MAEQIKFGDKLFLKGETLILDNGTSDAVIKSKNGTIQIDGNLTVSGTQTIVESETVTIADNILLVNSNVTGAPTENGGIEVERGTSDNASILWNETSDKFEFKVGSSSASIIADVISATTVVGAFAGDLSGNVTSTGLSVFADIDINGPGNIDATVIGATTPAAGTFTTLNATTITGAVTGTVTSIANHDTDDLTEGSANLYYTQARVDARYATLHANADADTLDNQDGTYYLDYTNFTNIPTTITSLANHSIDALSDVKTTGTGHVPSDGEALVWDQGMGHWMPGDSFSQSDFDIAFTAKDTDDLSEGTTNLYYTDTRARQSISATGSLSYNNSTGVISYTQGNTDTITEGTTNLYYTDARVQAVSINNVVEDTTPQLGGNLDLNTFDLSTTDPTVQLTTTTTPITTQGTVGASSDTNLSNTTVTVNTDGSDVANAVSSYVTLTSTEITNLSFEGEISLTYFGAAASSSNFVWLDVSESTEQNNMIVVYAPPADEYTFTLPTSSMGSSTLPINSLDNDIYFKQYAYGEMTVTSSTALSGSTIQLRDANGFYIDKEHVTVSSLGGTSYKIVFWTHDVSVGDVIDVIAASAQTAIFEWGNSTFSETGLTMSAESFSLQSSTNDIFAMGDLEFTLGLTTGEVVGTLIFDEPTGSSIISGLTTVTIDGTSYLSAHTITDVPIVLTGNASTSNEVSIAIGGPLNTIADARLWLLDSSGDLIYKFPAADGTANQVMKTDGSGDISWATQNTDDVTEGSTNLYYTAARDTAQFNTDLATKSTTNLAEGTNLYYTDARWNTKMTAASTSDLSEGTNLYYTNARADARAQLKIDALVDSAPGSLDTLNELAAALGDDANHVTTMTNLVSANTTLINNLNHDTLTGFVANEHIDWTADQGATNIHADNYTNTTYVNTDWDHDSLSGVVTNEHIDWTSASAGTIDPSNYVNTGNTTYTAGTGLTLAGTVFSMTDAHFDGNYNSLSNQPNLTTPTFTSVTTTDLTVSGTGSVVLASGNDLELTATDRVKVTGTTPFKFSPMTTAQRNALSLSENGDMIYNTTDNKFQGYENGSWHNTASTDITGDIIPATDNTYDLGSSTKKYANIYGHVVEATYADIAERYATDVPYESGTVVVFGGEAEITVTSELKDVSVAGVISTNPALKLNADAGNSQTHPYVALKGRVPCMLIGPVSKGDLIVTADNEPGYAQSIGKNDSGHSVFAKSIETDLTDGKKVIEVSIL